LPVGRLLGSHLQSHIFFATYKWAKKVRLIVPGRLLQSSLIFVGDTKSLPYSDHLNCAMDRLHPYS
jgi:hypothetical protein